MSDNIIEIYINKLQNLINTINDKSDKSICEDYIIKLYDIKNKSIDYTELIKEIKEIIINIKWWSEVTKYNKINNYYNTTLFDDNKTDNIIDNYINKLQKLINTIDDKVYKKEYENYIIKLKELKKENKLNIELIKEINETIKNNKWWLDMMNNKYDKYYK